MSDKVKPTLKLRCVIKLFRILFKGVDVLDAKMPKPKAGCMIKKGIKVVKIANSNVLILEGMG